MEFESATDAALRLGVTVRAIQKWAKQGKIPFAHKMGRDWLIPSDSVKPSDMCEKHKIYLNEPLPIIHPFDVGCATKYIENIKDPDDKQMALCEYYYLTGKFKESCITAEPYLDSQNPILAATASMVYVLANLAQGHAVKTQFAAKRMREIRQSCFDANMGEEILAVCVLCSTTIKTTLHLPPEDVPYIIDHIKHLDGGLRLFACYIMAYEAYLEKDYNKSLGIVHTALCLSRDKYNVSLIYLHIIAAMDYINLRKTELAVAEIEKARALAKPDGLVMPFVEHYNLLQGLIEKISKYKYPDEYENIIALTETYNSHWYDIYNRRADANVAHNLTNIEFTIAMLYSRNWHAKEIAEHMQLSERTITNYINIIYQKLHINNKKQLTAYMFK